MGVYQGLCVRNKHTCSDQGRRSQRSCPGRHSPTGLPQEDLGTRPDIGVVGHAGRDICVSETARTNRIHPTAYGGDGERSGDRAPDLNADATRLG